MRDSKGMQSFLVGVFCIVAGIVPYKLNPVNAGTPFGYFWIIGLPLAVAGVIRWRLSQNAQISRQDGRETVYSGGDRN